ncbi:MAG TPA: TlpA disulfide reductase family protein [Candidatus Methanoperedens sp.]|nr:TlpA disulfide reductase family protein [Candidatus Methanoperedens sp.]
MIGSRARRVAGLALVIAFTALALPAAPAAAVDAEVLPLGSPAPLFESEDPDGVPFALAEALKEGPVMLVFWSLFCGSCMEELPIIEQEKPKFEGKVQIFAVNLDEAPRARNVKQVAKQKGFTFRMLLNKLEKKAADGSVVKKEFQIDAAYKIKATPAVYLINRDGTIAYGHFGPLNPEELAAVVALAK